MFLHRCRIRGQTDCRRSKTRTCDNNIAITCINRAVQGSYICQSFTKYTNNPNPFQQDNPVLQAELARVSRGEKLSALDLSRLRLEPPTSSSSDTQPSPSDWECAVQNSQSQLEHQWNRIINLELMNKFGSNAWRIHNYQLDHAVAGVKKVAESNKEEILSINKQRKLEQVGAYDVVL